MNRIAKQYWAEILDIRTPLADERRQRRSKRQKLLRQNRSRSLAAVRPA